MYKVIAISILLTACGGAVDAERQERAPLPTEPGCYAFDPAAEGLVCDTSKPQLEPFLCIAGVEPGFECQWLRFTSMDGQVRSSYAPGNHPEQHPNPMEPVYRCCNIERPLSGQ